MRLRKIMGWSIAVALLAACSSPAMRYIGYRFAPDWTPTDEDAELVVHNLGAPVVIFFDKYAVPHIRAKDEPSAVYGLGYMHGRDRRFQMETLRLLAAGRMRELVGDKDKSGVLAHLEILSRMIDLDADARAILDSTTPADRAFLDAYAAGVNEATAREPQPLEFRLLNNYQPEPWTAKDSALITALVSFGLNKNWEQELGRLELIVHQLKTGGTIDRALAIWKPRYDLGPHLIGMKPAVDPFAGIPPIAPELADYLRATIKPGDEPLTNPSPTRRGETEIHSQFAIRNSPFDGPPDSFWSGFANGGSHSNNWAMSGAWTGTGRGAFAADPHMPHSMPPLGYLAHLKCDDGYEIIGAGFVGLPAIAFGTNGKVAWGPTSNWADVADLYVEKPVPGQPGSYEFRGAAEKFTVRNEVFRIRNDDGSYKTETVPVRVSRHGPLLNDFIDRLPADFPLTAIHRDVRKGKAITALRNLYRAGDVAEARRALADFSAMIGHWSLADVKGNIAYCGPVQIPRRTRHLGTVPVPGWTGTYEWEEFVPVADMPWVENPAAGYLGTANNQVIQPEATAFPINLEGDVPHRWMRIAATLARGRDGRPIPMQIGALQRDNLDAGVAELMPLYAPLFAALQNDADPLVAEAAKTLLDWDGRDRPESAAPTIFNSFIAITLRRTLEDEASPATIEFLMSYFNVEPLAFGILGDPSNPAWDDRRTPQVETMATVVPVTFRETVAALAKRYGPRIADWQWQKAAPFVLQHPFGSQSALASYVNRGPLPTAGSGNTVNKHQFMRSGMTTFPIKYGPVLRIAVDFNDLRGSRMSVPGGESGRPASRHYDDLLPLYLEGDGVSMDMDFANIEKAAKGRLVLKPRLGG